jgi:hypothetical protein
MRKLISIILILCIILQMSSCGLLPSIIDNSDEQITINPLPEAANKIDKQVTLYFRYTDENILAGERRKIDVPVNERLEMAVLKEIFEGPSNDSQELVSVIPKTATIRSVSDSGDYLFVTLSKEFIIDSKIASVDKADEEAYLNAKEEMQLAIYSIVNTLIELGGFSRIQLLVDSNYSGRGERIKLADIGVSGIEGSSLEPIGWDGSLVLNTENTVELFLDTFTERDFEDLFSLIAYNDSKNTISPAKDDFINILNTFEATLEDYSVLDSIVSSDGNSAIVAISFTLKSRDGDSLKKDNIIIRLKREKNLWKVEYSSFEQVFLTE